MLSLLKLIPHTSLVTSCRLRVKQLKYDYVTARLRGYVLKVPHHLHDLQKSFFHFSPATANRLSSWCPTKPLYLLMPTNSSWSHTYKGLLNSTKRPPHLTKVLYIFVIQTNNHVYSAVQNTSSPSRSTGQGGKQDKTPRRNLLTKIY